MSLLVLDSCGSLYSVYLSKTLSMSVDAYWNSLLELLKMMRAISQSQSTDSSYAFFIRPNFRLVNVTCSIDDRTNEIRAQAGHKKEGSNVTKKNHASLVFNKTKQANTNKYTN